MGFKTKILVIRLSSIGDIVLTTPVIRCLKDQLDGESELHFLVKEPFADVIKYNPHIDRLHIFTGDINQTVAELLKEDFHYIIDLHKNFRSIYIRKKLKVLSFTFPKLNFKKWLLVNFKVDLLPDIHIVDRYFEAVKPLGIKNDGIGTEFFIPENEQLNVITVFNLQPDTYVAIAIGGAHEGKKLSRSQLRSVCEMIKYPILLLGGKEDEAAATFIAEGQSHVQIACGKLSILQSASALQQSGLVISHDSGLMHIASAFKKKIISIWGATVPKFGMYPYLPHPDSVMIQADHLRFRPTSKLGNNKSRKEKRTTEEIDLGRISDAVERLW